MNDKEKILTALNIILSYELKTINYLMSFSKENKNMGDREIFEKIKKKLTEDLEEAELVVRKVVLCNIAKLSQKSGTDNIDN